MSNDAVPTTFIDDATHMGLPEPTLKPTTLTGQMESLTTVWTASDGKSTMGVWECEPGTFTAFRDGFDETCVIVAGRATVTGEDGVVVEVGPGDILATPKYWRGTWVVHETVRKIYNIMYL